MAEGEEGKGKVGGREDRDGGGATNGMFAHIQRGATHPGGGGGNE